MIKTSKHLFKHLRLSLMLIVAVFLLLETVQAQAVNFSSDHWPKRWGRAMNKPAMDVTFRERRRQDSRYEKARHHGWGQPSNEKRYERSKTPDYNNDVYNRYESDYLKRRYAVPRSMLNGSGYGSYPVNNYYGNYSLMPHSVYPAAMPGVYPGILPGASGLGLGVPGLGFPYASPFLLAPGLTPGISPGFSPGVGYPW